MKKIAHTVHLLGGKWIGPFCMTLPLWLGTGCNFDGIDFEKSFYHAAKQMGDLEMEDLFHACMT